MAGDGADGTVGWLVEGGDDIWTVMFPKPFGSTVASSATRSARKRGIGRPCAIAAAIWACL